MSSLFYFFESLRDRMPSSRAFVAPLVVSGTILVTWAWFAALATSSGVAGVFALALAIALFASWLSFANKVSGSASNANGKLLTQLGIENRGNRRLAIYDAASGLYNRWYLELRLQEEFLRCNRYGLSMAVVRLRLGDVNLAEISMDAWGGMASDLARAMAKVVRAVDITAALGPLDFSICLVHCDRNGAERAIQRVLKELHGHPAEVGLAVYPEDDCDGKALIELARSRSRPMTAPAQKAA